ncbi:hypothetical protein LCGC14_3150000, partial [marine sediment metagenome]
CYGKNTDEKIFRVHVIEEGSIFSLDSEGRSISDWSNKTIEVEKAGEK